MKIKKGQIYKMNTFLIHVTSVKNDVIHSYHIEDDKKYWAKEPVSFFENRELIKA